jgi:hypothetical protein
MHRTENMKRPAFVYFCVRIYCCGEFCTEPLPNNEVMGDTHRQLGDLVSILLFLQSKERTLKLMFDE